MSKNTDLKWSRLSTYMYKTTVPDISKVQSLWDTVNNAKINAVATALKIRFIFQNQSISVSQILGCTDTVREQLTEALTEKAKNPVTYTYVSAELLHSNITRSALKTFIKQSIESKGVLHLNLTDFDLSESTMCEYIGMLNESSNTEYPLYTEEFPQILKANTTHTLQCNRLALFNPIRSTLEEHISFTIFTDKLQYFIEVEQPVVRRFWTPQEILDIALELKLHPTCYNLEASSDYNYFQKLDSKPFEPTDMGYLATDIILEK